VLKVKLASRLRLKLYGSTVPRGARFAAAPSVVDQPVQILLIANSRIVSPPAGR
jgi:hypothetical protein